MPTVRPPTTKTTVVAATDYAAAIPTPGRLELPAGVRPFQLNWPYIIVIAGYHVVALLAFLPGYFSWSGLILAMLLTHLCGLFGINLCYHRLLTHRGFVCPNGWSIRSPSSASAACRTRRRAGWPSTASTTSIRDEQPDPHSPLVSFFWGHWAG